MANTRNESVANGYQMLSSINKMINENHNLIFTILNWLKKFLAALFCVVGVLAILALTVISTVSTQSEVPIFFGYLLFLGFLTWCYKDPCGMFADITEKEPPVIN